MTFIFLLLSGRILSLTKQKYDDHQLQTIFGDVYFTYFSISSADVVVDIESRKHWHAGEGNQSYLNHISKVIWRPTLLPNNLQPPLSRCKFKMKTEAHYLSHFFSPAHDRPHLNYRVMRTTNPTYLSTLLPTQPPDHHVKPMAAPSSPHPIAGTALRRRHARHWPCRTATGSEDSG